MGKLERANILGCQVDQITLAEAVERIDSLIDAGNPTQAVTLNAEMVYQAQFNYGLQKIINRATLVTPDGIGIIWAGRRLGYKFPERVTGIDLLDRLCGLAPSKNWGIYLLGSAPGVAIAAGEKLSAAYPGLKICGTHDGYFREDDLPEIIRDINSARPQILFVGLGAPKQEEWIGQYCQITGVPVCIGVGGSFDVLAGIKKRAPTFIIKLNLEWLYRLISEPARYKRQLALPKFMWLVLKSKIKS